MSAPTDKPIRVLLAEDHTIVREGVRALLSSQPDIQVVGEVGDGRAAVEEVEKLQPDVVVMDLGMPKLNGVDATREIRSRTNHTRIVVLSMYSGEEYVRPVIRAGASGYLLKGSGLSDLVSAIRAVAGGDAFFSPEVAKVLLEDSRTATEQPPKKPSDGLTRREREVLQYVAEGNSSPQIAEMLSLSVKTIEGHRGRIMSKLGIHNVAGLVRHAIKIGLVSAD
jgi:DNA-binding NarL/FixJ family response regulator